MKNINIQDEQNKIRDKINKIKQSGIFNKLSTALNQYANNCLNPFQETNINIYGRLKKVSSAFTKIVQKNISSDEIFDLIAFMLVVDLPEDYNNIQSLLLGTLSGLTYERLFIGTEPDCNGYSSLHFGINVDNFLSAQGMHNTTEALDLSAEIQLKTYGMYLAQEATHDSIYKNADLDNNKKLYTQSLMFPLIEHLTDIEMYERKLNATVDEEEKKSIEEKISDLKQTIKDHKENYSDFINDNIHLIDAVFEEYIARKSIEKLKSTVDSELSNKQIEKLMSTYRTAIGYSKTFQGAETLGNTEPTGFKNIDELLSQFENMDLNEVINLSQEYDEKMLETMMNVSKKSVTLSNVTSALEELEEHISSKSEKDETEQDK